MKKAVFVTAHNIPKKSGTARETTAKKFSGSSGTSKADKP
jgi:hypothetical protein